MAADDDDRLAIRPYADDDALIAAALRAGAPSVRVARPERPMVVLGRGGRPESELHVEACLADGIPVRRRRGGGGAVLLDPGNLVIAIAWPLPGLGGVRRAFARCADWIADALGELGIDGIELAGVSDLAVGDRKLGGSCIYRRKDLLYYATTLLVEPRLDLIERYIAHPPREPDYRRDRSHRRFLTSIAELDPAWDTGRLHDALASRLTAERFARVVAGGRHAGPAPRKEVSR